MYISMMISIFCISTIHSKEKEIIEKRSIISNLNKGLKYAGQIFGINIAADVANLISKSFSHAPTVSHDDALKREYYNEKKAEPISNELNFSGITANLLSFIGFDIKKIGALALSSILGIAETIASLVLSKEDNPFKIKDLQMNDLKVGANNYQKFVQNSSDENENENENDNENGTRHSTVNVNELFDSFLQQSSPKFRILLSKATNKELPEQIILMIENAEMEKHQAACVKMLICKCAPFIWNMQKTLVKRLTKSNQDQLKTQNTNKGQMFDVNALFEELPSKMELLAHGKLCSKRYANLCNITETAHEDDTKC